MRATAFKCASWIGRGPWYEATFPICRIHALALVDDFLDWCASPQVPGIETAGQLYAPLLVAAALAQAAELCVQFAILVHRDGDVQIAEYHLQLRIHAGKSAGLGPRFRSHGLTPFPRQSGDVCSHGMAFINPPGGSKRLIR